MVATKDAAGAAPARRLTKEELVNTHKTHLEKQNNSPHAPRAVKQPVMSDAYPASTKSIRELEIVNHTMPAVSGTPGLPWLTACSRYH
jgi:hypothetical protein